jgi:phage terminase large subunit
VTEGIAFNHDELISLPSTLPLLRTLQKELSQPTMSKGTRMRLVIDKAPEGTRSPNLADAVVMAYWPVVNSLYDSSMEWV